VGVAGSRMAVSAVVSWAASRSAGVVIDGADLGGAVVGTLGAAGLLVAALSGGAGGLTSDRLPPEQAANRATSRWIWR
jgi:hypothetical protein